MGRRKCGGRGEKGMSLGNRGKSFGMPGCALALGFLLCLCACKGRPGSLADREAILKDQFVLLEDSELIALSDSDIVIPDSETERNLRASGFVEIVEVDSSIRVCLVYATDSNFTGNILYTDMRKAFLLPEAARRLADAQRRLKAEKPDYSLIVYDAARPMSVQQKMWDKVKNTSSQVYVSNPANGGGLHNYGVAVDLSIVDSCGRMLEMGSPFDYFGDEAHPDKEASLLEQGRISPEAWKNRLLLRRVMKAAGFRPLHSEWWHFNLMSREEAKAKLPLIP